MRLSTDLNERLSKLSADLAVGTEDLVAEAVADLVDKYERKSKSLRGRTALVVDDSAIMRLVMEEHLTKAGVAVTARAENGFEAVKIFNGDNVFDYVFLNVVMPEMDGTEALEDFRKNHKSRIIMVTSSMQSSLVLSSIKNGAHHVLLRPFGYRDIFDVMSTPRVFSRDMYPTVKTWLEMLPPEVQLSQDTIRDLINHCNK